MKTLGLAALLLFSLSSGNNQNALQNGSQSNQAIITDSAPGSTKSLPSTGTGVGVLSAATIYYVDNCVVIGNDSNNGTSTSTPWLTIARVNRASFNPGDSVLFQNNCTWREQLTVRSAGNSTSLVTVGTYGTGTTPAAVYGSNQATSWTSEVQAAGSWVRTAASTNSSCFYALSDTVKLNATPTAGTTMIVQATILYSGVTASVTDNSYGPADSWTTLVNGYTYSSAGNGLETNVWATTVTAGTQPTNITVNLSARHIVCVGVDVFVGGQIPFVLDGSVATTKGASGTTVTESYTTGFAGDLVWAVEGSPVNQGTTAVASPFTLGATCGAGDRCFTSYDTGTGGAGVAANTQVTATYRQTSAGAWSEAVAGFEIGPSLTYYYVTGFTKPLNTVFENGHGMTLAASKSALLPGGWWWDSVNSRVYILPTNSVDPSTETFEIPQRESCIRVPANYVTVNGLNCQFAETEGMNVTGSNDIVENMTLAHIRLYTQGTGVGAHAILVQGTNYATVLNNTMNDQDFGILLRANYGTITGNIIQGNVVANGQYDGIAVAVSNSGAGSTVNNTTIQYNVVSYVGQAPSAEGGAVAFLHTGSTLGAET